MLTIHEDVEVLNRLPILATFETLVVVVAILIIVTSMLIVKNIHEKRNRTRADSMFGLLSVSDIGVGIISMTALGVFAPCSVFLYNYYQNGSISPLIITLFCYDLPYIFSSILTASIAIDRLFIMTWPNSYKETLTEMRLKATVALLFFTSFGYCCVTAYYGLPENAGYVSIILRGGILGTFVMSMIAVILAYIRILFFVRKRSKRMLAFKHNNSKSDGRLSMTIFNILICQVICIIPYLLLFTLQFLCLSLRYDIIGPWLVLLRNCNCFGNGFVLLHNQIRNAKKCESLRLEKNLNENKCTIWILSFATLWIWNDI